jgi:hypothetical protein
VRNLPEGVTGDGKFGLRINIFADVAWNDGNLAYKQQPGFHWSNCREI